MFYAAMDADWDANSIPRGIRGQWGDKRPANELSLRNITLHNAITAFGENLGWKGNVTVARLRGDMRFDAFSKAIDGMSADDRLLAADYMAARFAEGQQLNLLNAAEAQKMSEMQSQGVLQACVASQMAVANMQQRNAAATDLNTAVFVQTQHATHNMTAASEDNTWQTYLP